MAIVLPDRDRRLRLRRLDECLETLEREHERGRTRVTGPLAQLLRERVVSIRPGMLIVDAIDEVLLEQRPLMAESADSRGLRSRSSYLPKDKRDTYIAEPDENGEYEPMAETA